MPFWYYFLSDPRWEIARRKLAEKQVRAKFPALLEGSSGWDRAVRNRLQRLR